MVGSDSESLQDDNVVGNISKHSVVAPGHAGPIKRGHLIFNADFECGKYSLLSYYPHMPIGKVWIYRLSFLCLFVGFSCVCTVTDFSAQDKASGVEFCAVVYRRPGQGILHFGELCSPEAQNRTNLRAASGRTISMCG